MQYLLNAPASLYATVQLPASKSISNRALILHEGRIAEDLQLDTLAPGDSLLAHMASACHWDPQRYLAFEEE